MAQGYNQLNLFNRNLPMVITGGGAPSRISGIQYQEIPELMTRKPFDIGEGKQVGYKLPDGTYTSNPELVNIANQNVAKSRAMAATRTMKGVGKAGGAMALASIPASYIMHKDAYKYYDDMLKDPNTTPEQKQLAMAMRTNEMVQMLAEGPGTAVGTGIGSTGGKWGAIAGSTIPSMLAGGINWAMKKGLQPAMEQYKFQPYNGGIKLGGITLGGNSSKSYKSPQPENNGNKVQGQKTTGKTSIIPQQAGVTLAEVAQQPSDTTTEPQPNINAINDYVQQLKDVNQPYIDALQNYLNNYDDLYKRNYNAQRYWAAMSGLANNPRYANVANAYNPLVQEANRLNAIKQLQQAQATDVNAINEMMGNIAAVQQMGLTPETAFANKNLLTMMAAKDREDNRLQIALENNLMKKYGIDRNYARALTVQAMRNQGAMDRALLNASVYGGGYQPAPGLNARGQAATSQDLTMEQILQQAAKQNK